MEIYESFKPLGLLSILTIWVGCAFLVYRWPGKLNMSLSHHAAQTKESKIYYALLLIPAVTAFYVFMLKWFIPTFELSEMALYVLTFGVLGQYVACIVPDTKGWASKVHQVAAYIMSVTLSIMLGFVIFSQTISTFSYWSTLIILVIMLFLYARFLFVPKTKEKFLIYQSTYVMLFHLAILICTYAG
jgi:hypothetical protein